MQSLGNINMFIGSLKLELIPAVQAATPVAINFATRLPDGTLAIEKIAPNSLADKIGQRFTWTESILVPKNDSSKLVPTEAGVLESFYGLSNKFAIIKINDVIGYGVIALEDIPIRRIIGIYSGILTGSSIDIVQLPETSPLEALQGKEYQYSSTLVIVIQNKRIYCLDRLTETTTELSLTDNELGDFIEALSPTLEVKSVPIMNIPASMVHKIPVHQDDYRVGIDLNTTLSGLHYRNLLSFVNHALYKKNPSNFSSFETEFMLFMPVDKAKSQADWLKSIVTANLHYVVRTINNIQTVFFYALKDIKKGEYLAWNYGINYWKSRNICPAVISKVGAEIVDPSTYICTDGESMEFFNSMSMHNLKILAPDLFFKLCATMFKETAENYFATMSESDEKDLLNAIENNQFHVEKLFHFSLCDKMEEQLFHKIRSSLPDYISPPEFRLRRYLIDWVETNEANSIFESLISSFRQKISARKLTGPGEFGLFTQPKRNAEENNYSYISQV